MTPQSALSLFRQQRQRSFENPPLFHRIPRPAQRIPQRFIHEQARGGRTWAVISRNNVTDAVGMPAASMTLWISPTD
ncbi:MAG: hypothetical protein R2748_32750 [Bryobacterales bacterium]